MQEQLNKEADKTDYSSIEPIRNTIEPEKHAARYSMHRYFTRRPFNVIQEYINHFSNKGDTILDPYVGTGVTAVESLILRRKAIGVDIAPLSCFITKNIAISPVNLDKFKKAYDMIGEACQKEKFEEAKFRKINLSFLEEAKLPKNADVRTVKELFTPKQLWALYLIIKEVNKIPEKIIKDLMKFTFSSTLTFTNIMYDRGSSSPFAVYRYWVPKKLQEVDVWDFFGRRYKAVLKGKEETNKLIGDFYKEGDTFKIYNRSATELTKFIDENSIDYIFTDPPYGANIAYLDLSTMWDAWLGFKVGKKEKEEEAIEGGELGKTQQDYINILAKSFQEMFDVLKKDRWMSVVFHHKELKLWNAIVNSAKDAGFEYINTVSQPSIKMPTFRKIQSPLRALAGELIINFKKTQKSISKVVPIAHNVRGVILNTAERLIIQKNGATTDEIYHAIIPELLDTNLIDVAVKEVNDVTPTLKKEFDLDNKNRWQLKKDVKIGNWIPKRDRIKFYLTSMLKREKEMDLDKIYQTLMPLLVNGHQPDNKEIMEILEEIGEPTDGKWRLKVEKIQRQASLIDISKELPIVKFDMQNERKNHTEVIFALANLGKLAGFKIWIGKKEQGQKYHTIFLKEICDYEELPILELKREARQIIEQIDIIWFKKDDPVAAFEIENSTNVQTGIMRFVNLIRKEPKIASKLYIISPDSRKSKVEKELKNPAFIGDPIYIEKKVRYILYSNFMSMYNSIRKDLKMNISQIDSIARDILI